MDKVRLLNKHLKNFMYIKETGGSWVNGEYVEGSMEEITFKAAPFPIDQYTLSLLPQGALNDDSIKIYTKYDLGTVVDTNIKRAITGETYRVYKGKPFDEIADVKIYLLNRIEGES